MHHRVSLLRGSLAGRCLKLQGHAHTQIWHRETHKYTPSCIHRGAHGIHSCIQNTQTHTHTYGSINRQHTNSQIYKQAYTPDRAAYKHAVGCTHRNAFRQCHKHKTQRPVHRPKWCTYNDTHRHTWLHTGTTQTKYRVDTHSQIYTIYTQTQKTHRHIPGCTHIHQLL